MKLVKCGECEKEIDIPSNSDDEFKGTGIFCECLKYPICFECNMNLDISEIHNRKSQRCCAFGFPKVGDYFYPK